MNKAAQLARIIKLHGLFKNGQIPTLAQHEVNPGLDKSSRENYLYFTLAPCLNFQRSSPALWQAALSTWQDPETNYLFFPEEVIKKPREQIQKDLIKHKLALQRNKHTDIWILISKAFNELYQADPRELFEKNGWDVTKIHQTVQKDQKPYFPYLSGPKLSHYWLYILSQFTSAKFKNMQEISIIPDTHVLQSTVKLGITDSISDPLVVAQLWKELLNGSELSPVDMHPVLWNWSRNNFLPKV